LHGRSLSLSLNHFLHGFDNFLGWDQSDSRLVMEKQRCNDMIFQINVIDQSIAVTLADSGSLYANSYLANVCPNARNPSTGVKVLLQDRKCG